MAALVKRGKQYHVKFYYRGKQYLRTLATADEEDADHARKAAERRIHLLRTGALDVPEGTDPGAFIVGNRAAGPEPAKEKPKPSVQALFREYLEWAKPPRKAEASWRTERTHLGNFEAFLGSKVSMRADRVTPELIERFMRRRGLKVRPTTINKELQTLRQAFDYAVRHGHLDANPLTGVKKLKDSSENHRFMTKAQIDEVLGGGTHTDEQKRELKRFRYLEPKEVRALLLLAKESDLWAFLSILAFTGMRFSEARHLRWEDIDFEARRIWVRSRKQSADRQMTVRDVEMNETLSEVLREHRRFAPSSAYVFCDEDGQPLTSGWFRYRFTGLTKGTAFDGIGFHCLRHSFSSNLARAGVDDRIIDHFMGHQTEEMRRRYQHLFPSEKRRAIDQIAY